MTTFNAEEPWSAIRQDLKGPRPPVTAVVSFIVASGDVLMPLRRGDRLVCNADVDTVRMGLTNPETLQRFHKKGVEVFSIRGLHAKVIVGERFAWVGSANASDSGFLEAAIRVGPTGARPIQAWAASLCLEPWKLTATAIADLQGEKVRRARGLRKPIMVNHDVASITRLQLWWLDDEMSPEAVREAEQEKKKSSISRKESAFMNSLLYTEIGPDDDSIREGDWIVGFWSDEPWLPARVVRITPHQAFKIVWYLPVDMPRIPTMHEVEALVPEWWDQEHDWTFIIDDHRKVQAFLALYQ